MELKLLLIIASEGPRRAASVQQVNRQQSMRKGKAENGVGNQGKESGSYWAGQGIGRETALVLAQEGAVVCVSDINDSRGKKQWRKSVGGGELESIFMRMWGCRRRSSTSFGRLQSGWEAWIF